MPFTPKTLSFLRSLTRNKQKREWFHERKDQYQLHCRAPMIEVVERLAEDFRFRAGHGRRSQVSLLRPDRDTRFSATRRPEIHIGQRFLPRAWAA